MAVVGVAIVGIAIAVALLAGGDDEVSDPAGEPTAPVTAPASATPPTGASEETGGSDGAGDDGGPLLEAGKVTQIKASKGDTVRFRVLSEVPEAVHVHGYDIEKELTPGKPTEIEFKATLEGVFEVEFHDNEEQIGELTVEP